MEQEVDAMTYERFTDRLRKVMQLAHNAAKSLHHEYVGTEHLLMGLIDEGKGIGCLVLRDLGIHGTVIREEVVKMMIPDLIAGPDVPVNGSLPWTPTVSEIVQRAIELAGGLHHSYVGTEHLLIAMVRDEKGVAGQVLRAAGLTDINAAAAIDRRVRGGMTEKIEVDTGYQSLLIVSSDRQLLARVIKFLDSQEPEKDTQTTIQTREGKASIIA